MDKEVKEYEVFLAQQVIEKLWEIYDYIALNYSVERAKRKTDELFDEMQVMLKIFPEAGFSVDEKFGFRVVEGKETRGTLLKGDYVVLYEVLEKRVNVMYLFSTKEDYIRAFRE